MLSPTRLALTSAMPAFERSLSISSSPAWRGFQPAVSMLFSSIRHRSTHKSPRRGPRWYPWQKDRGRPSAAADLAWFVPTRNGRMREWPRPTEEHDACVFLGLFSDTYDFSRRMDPSPV